MDNDLSKEKRAVWEQLQARVVELAILVGGLSKKHNLAASLPFREWNETCPGDPGVAEGWDCEITAKTTGEVVVIETEDAWKNHTRVMCKLTNPPPPPKLLPRRLLEAAPAKLQALARIVKTVLGEQIEETKKATEAAEAATAEVKKEFEV